MAMTVKRAISLPKEQDARLQRLSRLRGAPYSRLVQAAIHFFLEMENQERLVKEYESYYSGAEQVRAIRQLAREFGSLTGKVVR